jgi:hypothetical protein
MSKIREAKLKESNNRDTKIWKEQNGKIVILRGVSIVFRRNRLHLSLWYMSFLL